MQISAKEIAQMLDGTLEGDPETIITHPGKIEDAVRLRGMKSVKIHRVAGLSKRIAGLQIPARAATLQEEQASSIDCNATFLLPTKMR